MKNRMASCPAVPSFSGVKIVVAILLSLSSFQVVDSFSIPQTKSLSALSLRKATFNTVRYADISSNDTPRSNPYFASLAATEPKPKPDTENTTTSTSSTSTSSNRSLRRELGSQENLMLPRQYSPNPDVVFPSMNHVSCALLNKTPSTAALKAAVKQVMQAHPLLRASIEGDGEPDKRIDLFQMVRQGDNHPCTFVTQTDDVFTADNVVTIVPTQMVDESWKDAFLRDLDDGSWCQVESTPLWKVELHRQGTDDRNSDAPSALLLSFNHAISDQSSASRLTDQILELISEYEAQNGKFSKIPKQQDIPPSVEESVLGRGQRWKDVQAAGISPGTIKYVAGKALEETKSPVILPDDFNTGGGGIASALMTISGKAAGGEDTTERKSVVAFRTLSKRSSDALLTKCRENGVSVTNALSAAITLTSTDFVSGNEGQSSSKERNYKILQSLDMRRFGAVLDRGESVGCLAGSMDLMHGPLKDGTGRDIRTNPTQKGLNLFWDLAKEGKAQTQDFIDTDGPSHAVRVFDFAMTISDMNNLVHLTAQSKDSQGRAYSAGFTNAGVFERLDSFEYEGDSISGPLKTKHGQYEIEDLFYAASNARSGCLYRFSCVTVNGELKFTFHPASPIVSQETNEKFADALIELLEVAAGVREVDVKADSMSNPLALVPKNSLVLATATIGTAAMMSHANAFIQFFHSVMEMKANVDPEDFWPALNFWIFFAVGHPILQPILWISDVLHGSPGPLIGDLVPVTFLLGNVIAIAIFSYSKEIRNALNVAALFAFLTYVGAGLDGQAGLGDFNLALDDSYKGQVVKGCPTYEEVRQPSMNDFDLQKYQGLWYEQKFHDWTQFKEVYDTTLDIKLTDGGQGWVDDFAVKGPAPDAAPLSWDKSPVANGAHYFLFGRVDPSDPNGILRESGFGVEFPNYIVDVKKDPQTGEYTEAIQFQCLERGGVRVFEGINFMSRKPQMTDEEMAAMHARAEKAGMYPYGASPEQMHTVARRPVDAPNIDNSWQAMWRAIGVDKLLELLTESIEDGGR
ncbi:alcohol acetyltransferase [Nitzschia inconspicua]|uniref:Alcohol acetyltransferase n=1 Tax=Nitzschia inconspicua TaxID=303405 RepID=A0A9K3LCY4_9STRA|nr:alcohol acetyltransferase [Nitzschia inconspicua]